MRRVMEYCDDKEMENCGDRGYGHCDERFYGALRGKGSWDL